MLVLFFFFFQKHTSCLYSITCETIPYHLEFREASPGIKIEGKTMPLFCIRSKTTTQFKKTVDLVIKETLVNVVAFHSTYRNLIGSSCLTMEHVSEVSLG